jgi:acetyl-CoA carboxylase biotin carboxyl carrier protein
MAAVVCQLSVAEGDVVESGDTILILEVMKTEIPITAPQAGTVAILAASRGATVQEGDLLAVIE